MAAGLKQLMNIKRLVVHVLNSEINPDIEYTNKELVPGTVSEFTS
jgi:hypothetical protein